MDTPILSDIKVLDNLLALNLNVSLWSARKKMVLEDFGGAELPPGSCPEERRPGYQLNSQGGRKRRHEAGQGTRTVHSRTLHFMKPAKRS